MSQATLGSGATMVLSTSMTYRVKFTSKPSARTSTVIFLTSYSHNQEPDSQDATGNYIKYTMIGRVDREGLGPESWWN